MSKGDNIEFTKGDGGVISDPTPVVFDSSNTFIEYQGLKIKLQDLLNELNDADLLPESSKIE